MRFRLSSTYKDQHQEYLPPCRVGFHRKSRVLNPLPLHQWCAFSGWWHHTRGYHVFQNSCWDQSTVQSGKCNVHLRKNVRQCSTYHSHTSISLLSHWDGDTAAEREQYWCKPATPCGIYKLIPTHRILEALVPKQRLRRSLKSKQSAVAFCGLWREATKSWCMTSPLWPAPPPCKRLQTWS